MKSHKNPKKKDSILFRAAILAVSIALLCFIWVNREELKNLSEYGYAGIFVINFLSAATVLFPAPGTATVFIGGAVWNPFIVGLVSGLGSGLGELFAYFLGYGGRGLLKDEENKHKWIIKLEKAFSKSGFRTSFIFAALPLPFFDVIGVIAGAVNYPVWKFLLAVTSARILRNILFAIGGDKFLT